MKMVAMVLLVLNFLYLVVLSVGDIYLRMHGKKKLDGFMTNFTMYFFPVTSCAFYIHYLLEVD